jgi:hypothetical protein
MLAIIISEMLAVMIFEVLAIRILEMLAIVIFDMPAIIIAAADHNHNNNNNPCGGRKGRTVSIYWINPNSINNYKQISPHMTKNEYT